MRSGVLFVNNIFVVAKINDQFKDTSMCRYR